MSEFNKSTTIGLTLINSLNEMVQEGSLSREAGRAIERNFLTSFPGILEEVLGDPVCKKPIAINIEGQLLTYNNVETMWRLDSIETKLLTSQPGASMRYVSQPTPDVDDVAASIACGLRNSDRSKTRLHSVQSSVTEASSTRGPDDATDSQVSGGEMPFVDLGITSVLLTEEARTRKRAKTKAKM